jgi:hypothetical protein
MRLKDVEGRGLDVNWCKYYYLVEVRKITGNPTSE